MTSAMGSSAAPAFEKIKTDTDCLWNAVLERNPGFDGLLFFGVRSTGIYCKPSCPSRRPRPERVSFFFSTAEAERAGFRACRRCHPERLEPAPNVLLARDVCRYIEENFDGTVNLRVLSAALGQSQFHLQKTFKKITGISPHEYLESRRMSQFRTGLRVGMPVADAIYEAGFSSSSRVYERSHEHLGMTPAAYRSGAAENQIVYAIAESPLGQLLVAATRRGICRIALDGDERKLEALLFGEFPKAAFRRDQAALGKFVRQILGYLQGRHSLSLELPLDIRATTFQIRVWKELQKIPLGETVTYAEVAERMHRPRAVRAVANACASNPVALAVPCHRVVRKSGEMGGYRWGSERKRKLLKMEEEMAAKEKGK